MSTRSVIAVLDDEPRMRSALHRLLAAHGFVIENYACGTDLLTALPLSPADCLLLDLHMPGMTGFDVLAALAKQKCPMPILVLTADDEPGTAERVFSLGAAAILKKPVDETMLVQAIKSVLAGQKPESAP